MASRAATQLPVPEKRLNAEASVWVRAVLREFYTADDAAFEPRTASDVLHLLDEHPGQPSAWARLVRSDSAAFNKRYALVRTALEHLAKKRVVVTGSTINAKGNPRSTTYVRPHDASGAWSLELETPDGEARRRATEAFTAWLQHEGGQALQGIERVALVRKR